MIVRWIGHLFRAWARFTPGPAGRDLDTVGAELLRLARRPRHAATTSR
jgi:hypothetical protein